VLAFITNKRKQLIHNKGQIDIFYYDSPIYKILALVCGADEKERLGVEGFTAIY